MSNTNTKIVRICFSGKEPNEQVLAQCLAALRRGDNSLQDVLKNISERAHFQMDSNPTPELKLQSQAPVQSAPYLAHATSGANQGFSSMTSTTKFVDPSLVKQNENRNNNNDLAILDELHSIRKILRRPALLKEITLDSSSTPLTLFGPQTALANVQVPREVARHGNKLAKIANFTYFRARTCIKVQINAMPFTSGKLWICFAPYDKTVMTRNSILQKSFCAVTSYPGVELDLAKTNAAELDIPWSAVEEASYTWDIHWETYVYIFAMTPIRGPAGFTANAQVFGWLEDVDLKGPTYRLPSATFQMANEDQYERQRLAEEMKEARRNRAPQYSIHEDNPVIDDDEFDPEDLAGFEEDDRDVRGEGENKGFFSRMKNFLLPQWKHRRSESRGIIGKIAGVVSDVSRINIPVVKEFLKPVSWVSDLVGLTANVFGWSRPVEGSGAPAITNISGRGMAQTTCTDQAVVLGFDNQNDLAANQVVFLREEDEMAVDFIASRPGLIDISPYSKTTKTGDLVAWFKVGMGLEGRRVKDAAQIRTLAPTCIEAAARLFSHWRADFHFRISVAKTPFHTGRLEVIFVPGYFAKFDPNFDATNCYRTIMDLSRQNETTIDIPFLSLYEMLQITSFDNGDNNILGFVVVRALTPLVCPDSVADTVDVCTWKWASNVSFAGTAYASTIIPQASFQMDVGTDERIDRLVVYEKPNTPKSLIDVAQRVCGEMLKNLRPITRAHRLYGDVPPPIRQSDDPIAYAALTSFVGNGFALGTVVTSQGEQVDYISRLSDLYAYFKGGLSYKIQASTVVSTENTTNPEQNALGGIPSVTMATHLTREPLKGDGFRNNSFRPARAAFHISRSDLTPFHECMVPFYSNTRTQVCNMPLSEHSNLIFPGIAVSQHSYSAFTNLQKFDTGVTRIVTSPATMGLDVYRAAKDDFSFGCLIGSPNIVEPIL
jgi:hypothetical protein